MSRIDVPLTNYKAQFYEGAFKMIGAKTGVATRINEIGSRADLIHCYGHALQLAVGDTIKVIKIMRGIFDAA